MGPEEMLQQKQQPSPRRSFANAPLEVNISTEELEERLVLAVLKLEERGTLPAGLSNPVHRYLRAKQELQTHMRGPLILSHDEYAEVHSSIPVLREQIVDFCLRYNLFQ